MSADGTVIQIRQASVEDLLSVVRLFDSYREFYGQPPDSALAESFIRARLEKGDSVIFLAVDMSSGEAHGFTQLYPSFSSVAAQRIWILNDLFIAPEARRRGVGRLLLEAARAHAVATGATRITLSTAATNEQARALYESCGYELEDVFVTYNHEL